MRVLYELAKLFEKLFENEAYFTWLFLFARESWRLPLSLVSGFTNKFSIRVGNST